MNGSGLNIRCSATGTADQDIALRKIFNVSEAPLILCPHAFLCMRFYCKNDIRKSFYNKIKLLPLRISRSDGGISHLNENGEGNKLVLDKN